MPSSNYVGPSGERWEGSARRKARAATFALHGRVCWMCGHPGAQDVDHLDPPKHGGSMFDVENLRPIHDVITGCPSCGRKCNRDKGDKPLSQVVRLVTSQDWYSR